MLITTTAHLYAQLGWPVLPLEPRGKSPLSRLVRHGVKQATTDPSVLHEWAQKEPRANLGVACKNILCVLDVDLRSGGQEELERLCSIHGPLPFTPWQRTGTGGHHFVFAHPGGALRGKVGPGLDLLHGDKYFLVSPSIHPCGGRYAWTTEPGQCPPATMPAWLLSLARPVERQASEASVSSSSVLSSSQRVARGRVYASRLDPAVSGQHGSDTTMKVIAKLVHKVGLGADETLEALSEWNARCSPPWPEAELRRKISGVMSGGSRERRTA